MNRKKIFLSFCVLLALFGLLRLYFYLTDDFRVSNINYELPYEKAWEFSALTEEEKADLQRIFSQKFYYLGKGAQVYAFASADGKWVIKFLKFKHLKPSLLDKIIPPIFPFDSIKKAKIARKERKLKGVFEGYRLAYLYDRNNAGLSYLHFNKTDKLNMQVTLVDKIGWEHQLALDSVVFILQKKGQTLREVMSRLLKDGNVREAKEKALKILDMYLSEYAVGIWDRDHGITHNTGFIEEQPIHLDVGKISFDEKMKKRELYRSDLLHVGFKISSWIEEHFPQYHQEMLLSIEKHLSEMLGDEAHVQKPA